MSQDYNPELARFLDDFADAIIKSVGTEQANRYFTPERTDILWNYGGWAYSKGMSVEDSCRCYLDTYPGAYGHTTPKTIVVTPNYTAKNPYYVEKEPRPKKQRPTEQKPYLLERKKREEEWEFARYATMLSTTTTTQT
jgi:hypothetical protein